MEPLISVIIPVYNVERWLGDCLRSVCGQTLERIEIICVDDGSSDRSPEILKEFAEKDARIRIIRQENAGAGAARNAGLRAAEGKYLSFLDSDDFFEPDLLESLWKKAEEEQADMVACDSDQFFTDTGTYLHDPFVFRREELPPYGPFDFRQVTDNVFTVFVGWAWDKLYLRAFVEELGLVFQEQRTTNDLLFVFSALAAARRISIVDRILVHQRLERAGSLSVTRERSWDCFYRALTALKVFLKKQGLFEELERDYVNYALRFTLWNLDTLKGPSRAKLTEALCGGWLQELGITGRGKQYFYDAGEYRRVLAILKRGDSAAKGLYKKELRTGSCRKKTDHSGGKKGRLPAFRLPEFSPETPFAVNIAFDREESRLKQDGDRWNAVSRAFWRKKFFCYAKWEKKLRGSVRQVFRDRALSEFRRALQKDEIRGTDLGPAGQISLQCKLAGFYLKNWRRYLKPGDGLRRMLPGPVKHMLKKLIWK